MVTSVKSTITPSSFDVSISALHEGIEFKNNKLLPATGDVGRFFEKSFKAEDPPPDVVRREIKSIPEEISYTNPSFAGQFGGVQNLGSAESYDQDGDGKLDANEKRERFNDAYEVGF